MFTVQALFLRCLIGGTGIDSGGAKRSRKTRIQVYRKYMNWIGARARFVEVTWGEAGKCSPVDYLDSRVTQMTLSFSPMLILAGHGPHGSIGLSSLSRMLCISPLWRDGSAYDDHVQKEYRQTWKIDPRSYPDESRGELRSAIMQSSVVEMPMILWLATRNADQITELYCTFLARALQGSPGKNKVQPGANSGLTAGRLA
ncbi:hypothetical protein N431DRAFT_551266 [Stipitochalara longipes BDJ]|nr:hypothetical protein N431DRAFT_551266 [Stipitochalara longipes BDJ]